MMPRRQSSGIVITSSPSRLLVVLLDFVHPDVSVTTASSPSKTVTFTGGNAAAAPYGPVKRGDASPYVHRGGSAAAAHVA